MISFNNKRFMKKIVAVSVCMVCMLTVSDTVFSQDYSYGYESITFGVKGGYNQITLNNSDINHQSGYQFGIFVTRDIFDDWLNIPNMQLRSELSYSRFGAEIQDRSLNTLIFDGVRLFDDDEFHGYEHDRNTGGAIATDEIFQENVSSTITYQFINAPVRFNYLFLKEKGFTPFITAGPTFSILLDVDYSFSLTTEEGDKYTQKDIDSNVDTHFKRFNMALDLGAGIHLPWGGLLEVYYTFGLINSLVHYDGNINQSGLVANIGFGF